LQAGSGAWIGQTPGASARAEWVNNAYYDSVNTRWEYIAADEANRIYLENGELHLQSADSGSADGAITWNEKLAMTVGGDFKIGPNAGIGITLSSSGNIDAIGIITATTFKGGFEVTTATFSGDITANGNITGDGSTDISGINDATVSMLSISDTITHTGDTDTKIRFPSADTITAETGGSERLRIQSTGVVNIGDTTATSVSDRLLQIGKTDRSNTYVEVRTSTSGAGGIVFSDGTANDNTGYRGTVEYIHSSDYMMLKTAATERFRIGSSGQLGIGGATYGSSGQVLTSGGSGSAPSWTTITGTTINNNANNRVITGSGTANTLEGESTFTYDGSGNVGVTNSSGAVALTITTANNTDGGIYFTDGSDGNKGAVSYLHTTDTMNFRVNGQNKVKITSGGNLDVVTNARLRVGDGQEIQIYDDGNDGFIQKTGTGGLRIDSSQTVLRDDQGDMYIQCVQNAATSLYYNGNLRFETNTDATTLRGGGAHRCEGHFRPFANDTYDLGTSSDRWRNVYTTDLQLSNESKKDTGGNDVDGTWGDYTIQEGESNLFLINNRSGKKFKFMLQEVS